MVCYTNARPVLSLFDQGVMVASFEYFQVATIAPAVVLNPNTSQHPSKIPFQPEHNVDDESDHCTDGIEVWTKVS